MADRLSWLDIFYILCDRLCNRRYRRFLLCGIFIFIGVGSLLGYFLYKLSAREQQITNKVYPDDPTERDEVLRVVHLDLKGAPPKMSYLIDLIPKLTRTGVNGLLIEYEDMFPYWGILENVTSKTPYSALEVERFVRYCYEQNIEVIPLIQTFAHMEHILKLPDFSFLREDYHDPRVICPSNVRSMAIIKEMIHQIKVMHPHSKKIHIGCDEVTIINVCSLCSKQHRSNWNTFHTHVREVASFIKVTYNNQIKVLIWDDMLRFRDYDMLKHTKLQDFVDIVIWDYTALLEEPIRNSIWNKYTSIFPRIWVAGAFKGADGPKSMLPQMETRYKNHKSWMEFLRFKASSTKIIGFISTGWSRYDHFASLCELLPASIPSLILNTLKITDALSHSHGHDIENEYNDLLQCYRSNFNKGNAYAAPVSGFKVYDILHTWSHVDKCLFREARLISSIANLTQIQDKIDTLYDVLYEKNGWIDEYHLKSNMMNTKIVAQHFHANSFKQISSSFYNIYGILNRELLRFYNNNTVEEWLGTYVEPFSRKLETLQRVLDNTATTFVWQRRDP